MLGDFLKLIEKQHTTQLNYMKVDPLSDFSFSSCLPFPRLLCFPILPFLFLLFPSASVLVLLYLWRVYHVATAGSLEDDSM